jgi:protein SCO1/2
VPEARLDRRQFLALRFARDAAPARASEPWRLPDVALRTQTGDPVHLYQDLIRDQVVVVHLLCTAWDEQARVVRNLERVHELLEARFGREAWLLSLSIDVDAQGESVGQPTACQRMDGARDRWLTLTGEPRAIDAVRRAVGAWDPDPVRDADRARFAGLLTLGSDRTGRWASLPALLDPTDVILRLQRLDGA